jgi:hypothetical protein
MMWKSVGSGALKLATAATLVLSCTLNPESAPPGAEAQGAGAPLAVVDGGGGGIAPILVDVDANQVMKATPGTGVGVFTEYKTGGHWHVWWTCDTSVSGYSCMFDVTLSAESGAIANAATQGPDGGSVTARGSNSIEVTTTTTNAVDGVTFDTDPGAVISLDAKLDGTEDGTFLFFVQDGQINGGYQGTLSDPLLLEPAPGGA